MQIIKWKRQFNKNNLKKLIKPDLYKDVKSNKKYEINSKINKYIEKKSDKKLKKIHYKIGE